jgi:hypothetical protein
MGTITRSFANNLTTGGVLKADAFNNASLNNVTALNAAIATGNMILLSSQTASASASISFTTGIDSTYKEYVFYFINIHGATDDKALTVGFRDGDTAYDATKTTTFFRAYHEENGTASTLAYATGSDLAQSTAFQNLGIDAGNDNDQSTSGYMHLFNPSSTTYVKHFTAVTNCPSASNQSFNSFVAGYCNTTSAIDGVQFKMSSGNIDDGTILMYGIK